MAHLKALMKYIENKYSEPEFIDKYMHAFYAQFRNLITRQTHKGHFVMIGRLDRGIFEFLHLLNHPKSKPVPRWNRVRRGGVRGFGHVLVGSFYVFLLM